MLDIKALQAAFATPKNENNNSENNFGNYYPFWEMNDGEQCIVRFLPDLNEDNPMGFLLEKLTHKLVVNGNDRKVPCLSMFGEECPICKVSQEYYNDKNDPDNGRKYYRKKQHLTQVLVVEDPLPPGADGKTHEGEVRNITLGFQLFNIIKDAFESGDLDEVPYAYEGGCDFIIKKSAQGDWSTYTVGTKFARRSSDLSKSEVAHVKEHLVDLSTLLPKKPNIDEVNAMLNASLTGNSYVSPNSTASRDNTEQTVTSKVASMLSNESVGEESTPVSTESEVPFSTDDETDESLDAEAMEIMARIKSRKK